MVQPMTIDFDNCWLGPRIWTWQVLGINVNSSGYRQHENMGGSQDDKEVFDLSLRVSAACSLPPIHSSATSSRIDASNRSGPFGKCVASNRNQFADCSSVGTRPSIGLAATWEPLGGVCRKQWRLASRSSLGQFSTLWLRNTQPRLSHGFC